MVGRINGSGLDSDSRTEVSMRELRAKTVDYGIGYVYRGGCWVSVLDDMRN